jgi:hypothetical protein
MTANEIDNYGMSNALHCAILRGMIQIFNKLFPETEIENNLPNPLSTKIKANIKYIDVLNYFSQLNSN